MCWSSFTLASNPQKILIYLIKYFLTVSQGKESKFSSLFHDYYLQHYTDAADAQSLSWTQADDLLLCLSLFNCNSHLQFVAYIMQTNSSGFVTIWSVSSFINKLTTAEFHIGCVVLD
jgi:hypothetical protein